MECSVFICTEVVFFLGKVNENWNKNVKVGHLLGIFQFTHHFFVFMNRPKTSFRKINCS